MSRFRLILDQPREREYVESVHEQARESRWVLARLECVSAVRRSRDWGCILSFSSSLPLSPFLSRILSNPLTQRNSCWKYPGGQSVRRQPSRRRDASLSLSLLFLSVLVVRTIAILGHVTLIFLFDRIAFVNFLTDIIWEIQSTPVLVNNCDKRYYYRKSYYSFDSVSFHICFC